jgi:hypothetical protein
VAAVHHLEERDLGVTRQVHILGAVSYELHKTTTCHFGLYLFVRKKISGSRPIWPKTGSFWNPEGLPGGSGFQNHGLNIKTSHK